jgi:hypothetical protein
MYGYASPREEGETAMPNKMVADVYVTAKGAAGAPTAHIAVDPRVSAEQLSTLIQRVTTSKEVLTAAGLRACGGCKSGLDILIRNRFDKVIQVGL